MYTCDGTQVLVGARCKGLAQAESLVCITWQGCSTRLLVDAPVSMVCVSCWLCVCCRVLLLGAHR